MVLDCLQLVLPGSKHNTCNILQPMTLITQHKPIQRSTDMAVMIKTSQIQAWLNGLYTEHRVSKHIHAGRRPGAPAPMMIQRKPTLTQQTIQRSRHFVFQSTPDLPAHDSGSCGSVCFIMFLLSFSSEDQRPLTLDAPFFLPSKLRPLRAPICKTFSFEHVSFSERGQFLSQDIICQNIANVLSCQASCCQTIVLQKYRFATISVP